MPLAEAPWAADEEEPHPIDFGGCEGTDNIRVEIHASSFTGVIAPEADLRARSIVNREADGYGLISATLFELGEAGAVVSTEVAV